MQRLAIFLALAALVAGCELSNNPLLVSGAFVNATFRVDQEGLPPNTPVGSAASVRLADMLAEASDVADSVKIYNITVTIDSLTGATSGSAPLSATAGIDGRELFRLTDVPLSALGREHSIFDTSVAGCTFTSSGVQYLVSALRQSPPPTVTVGVVAHSSSTALHFTLRVKIYTQVYTTP